MSKLWAGRFSKQLDSEVNDFNSSIPFDSRMAQQEQEHCRILLELLGK